MVNDPNQCLSGTLCVAAHNDVASAGGAYILGDGYEFGLYDPRNLVKKQDVIIVTFNYRLHVFGFLAHAALANEDPNRSTGNYAMQDQRMALQWVQKNIANFGGNPAQVTIFGESAGAFSVCYHMASPASKGLFQAAIMESGSCDTNDFFQTYDLATTFGDLFTAAVGCNSTKLSEPEFLKCIRSKSTADLTLSVTTWLDPNWPYGILSKADGSINEATRAEWAINGAESPLAHTPYGAKHPSALRRALTMYSHQIKRSQEPDDVRNAILNSGGLGKNPLVPNLGPAMPWGPCIDGSVVLEVLLHTHAL